MPYSAFIYMRISYSTTGTEMTEYQMIHHIVYDLIFTLADLQMRYEQAQEWYPSDPLCNHIKVLQNILNAELGKFSRLGETYPQCNWEDYDESL